MVARNWLTTSRITVAPTPSTVTLPRARLARVWARLARRARAYSAANPYASPGDWLGTKTETNEIRAVNSSNRHPLRSSVS